MNLQQEYQYVQEQLFQVPRRINVFFEAHYWGKFRLLAPLEELFPDPEGFILLAQSQSAPYDQWLLLDPDRQNILLRRGDEKETTLIATSLLEFWNSWEHWQQALEKNTAEVYFDYRKKLEDLLPPSVFLVTPFNDPEYFEAAHAYQELLDYCDQLSGGRLAFDRVEAFGDDEQKTILIQKGDRHWSIHIHKILFDQHFIDQLNALLPEWGIEALTFATSISKDMRMILLLLQQDQLRLLSRLGLLI